MRVAVAGATGVLGRSAMPALARRRPRGARLRPFGAGWSRRSRRPGPASIAMALLELARDWRPEAILHLATAIPPAVDPRRRGRAVRPDQPAPHRGHANLVAAAEAAGGARLLSQSIAFMNRPGEGLASEEDPLRDRAGDVMEPIATAGRRARAADRRRRRHRAAVRLVLRTRHRPRRRRRARPAAAARKLPILTRRGRSSTFSFIHVRRRRRGARRRARPRRLRDLQHRRRRPGAGLRVAARARRRLRGQAAAAAARLARPAAGRRLRGRVHDRAARAHRTRRRRPSSAGSPDPLLARGLRPPDDLQTGAAMRSPSSRTVTRRDLDRLQLARISTICVPRPTRNSRSGTCPAARVSSDSAGFARAHPVRPPDTGISRPHQGGSPSGRPTRGRSSRCWHVADESTRSCRRRTRALPRRCGHARDRSRRAGRRHRPASARRSSSPRAAPAPPREVADRGWPPPSRDMTCSCSTARRRGPSLTRHPVHRAGSPASIRTAATPVQVEPLTSTS